MSLEIALPVLIASGLGAVLWVTNFDWPRVQFLRSTKAGNGFRVTEIAVSAGGARASAVGEPKPRRGLEFVIYVTLKTGSNY